MSNGRCRILKDRRLAELRRADRWPFRRRRPKWRRSGGCGVRQAEEPKDGGRLLAFVGLGFWQAWWMVAMCTDALLPDPSETPFQTSLTVLLLVLSCFGYLAVVLAREVRLDRLLGRRGVFVLTAVLSICGSLGIGAVAHTDLLGMLGGFRSLLPPPPSRWATPSCLSRGDPFGARLRPGTSEGCYARPTLRPLRYSSPYGRFRSLQPLRRAPCSRWHRFSATGSPASRRAESPSRESALRGRSFPSGRPSLLSSQRISHGAFRRSASTPVRAARPTCRSSSPPRACWPLPRTCSSSRRPTSRRPCCVRSFRRLCAG